MNIDEIDKMLLDHEKRLLSLEGIDPPKKPVVPPPAKPPGHSAPYDHELAMDRAHHIDFAIGAAERVVFRFKFTEPGGESYTHITAVLRATGPCLTLAIPEYGYGQNACREETSEGIATSDKFTKWVVRKGEHVYLHVVNHGGAGVVRLKANGENVY